MALLCVCWTGDPVASYVACCVIAVVVVAAAAADDNLWDLFFMYLRRAPASETHHGTRNRKALWNITLRIMLDGEKASSSATSWLRCLSWGALMPLRRPRPVSPDQRNRNPVEYYSAYCTYMYMLDGGDHSKYCFTRQVLLL